MALDQEDLESENWMQRGAADDSLAREELARSTTGARTSAMLASAPQSPWAAPVPSSTYPSLGKPGS